jgi:transcriptional regulator with XRE-family HTH domain
MAAVENKKKPNPTDIHVGSRIRLRRNIIGISQEKLGDHLGITFQQIQKYERGTNRVGASRLQAIANVLGVPVSFFFEDLASNGDSHAADFVPVTSSADSCNSAEGLQLNRAFFAIADPEVRLRIVELVKSLARDAANHSTLERLGTK